MKSHTVDRRDVVAANRVYVNLCEVTVGTLFEVAWALEEGIAVETTGYAVNDSGRAVLALLGRREETAYVRGGMGHHSGGSLDGGP